MQKLCIYIVEDNALIARALKRTIGNIGHQICGTAECYETAVKELQLVNADLVITDIMIKGKKTGIDLAHYINEHLKIPFIFQSSVTCRETVSLALQTLPHAFLPKLASREVIANILKTLSVHAN